MVQVAKGLEGVVVGETALSDVQGEYGRLIYRGYDIADLARGSTYEEIVFLLWMDHLPTRQEFTSFQRQMAELRAVPASVLEVVRLMPSDANPMDVLRTGASALGVARAIAAPATVEQAMALTAAFPTIVAAFDRVRRGLEPVAPRADLGHAANYLYMLSGEVPGEQPARALDTYLILTADHGFNASTFTARVIASTLSDICSAVVGGIAALKGPLHGGAPSLALDMLRAIGTPENAESWISAALDRHEPLMGFGHRVYKAEDPRARILRDVAEQMSEIDFFRLATHTEDVALRLLQEKRPGRRLYTNVEFYTAAVLHAVGLPEDFFPASFAVSRVGGWTAHVLEQLQGNRLIRPAVDYTGPDHLRYVPIDER